MLLSALQAEQLQQFPQETTLVKYHVI